MIWKVRKEQRKVQGRRSTRPTKRHVVASGAAASRLEAVSKLCWHVVVAQTPWLPTLVNPAACTFDFLTSHFLPIPWPAPGHSLMLCQDACLHRAGRWLLSQPARCSATWTRARATWTGNLGSAMPHGGPVASDTATWAARPPAALAPDGDGSPHRPHGLCLPCAHVDRHQRRRYWGPILAMGAWGGTHSGSPQIKVGCRARQRLAHTRRYGIRARFWTTPHPQPLAAMAVIHAPHRHDAAGPLPTEAPFDEAVGGECCAAIDKPVGRRKKEHQSRRAPHGKPSHELADPVWR